MPPFPRLPSAVQCDAGGSWTACLKRWPWSRNTLYGCRSCFSNRARTGPWIYYPTSPQAFGYDASLEQGMLHFVKGIKGIGHQNLMFDAWCIRPAFERDMGLPEGPEAIGRWHHCCMTAPNPCRSQFFQMELVWVVQTETKQRR